MVDLTGVLCAGALILCAWKVFDWLWWKPKRLERYFREQGIEGPSYKLIHGNLKEDAVASMEAIAKPMKSFSHAIAPRICPFLHQSLDKYGKVSLFWTGGTPRLNIMDADLVRDVLTNKSGHFITVTANPYEKVFVTGLVGLNGGKWAKHRKIINPAFHLEKLKGLVEVAIGKFSPPSTLWLAPPLGPVTSSN
ncbi:hypothetical protein Syun_027430 [Stephania yunnanensis]|uniref:Cytochrome P450 n=1 Tax=Stephania yunnanensis TaxID=152371 RepID=A0AAP0HMT5_9MAGN